MVGLRVGVEVEAGHEAVAAVVATLPWMVPEPIALDGSRTLILLHTSFVDPIEACAYALRRLHKTAAGVGLPVRVLSTEAFPLPEMTGPGRLDRHHG